MVESKCTIRLLTQACQAVSRIKKNNIIDPTEDESHSQILIDMAKNGYAITKSIAPIGVQGTGETSLAALCLEPQDPQSPIVISFRGTKTGKDVISDIRLSTLGVVEKEFRDAAFKFYEDIKKANPGRQIVLTGHSLGGHLAQYVATKAYNTDPL